MNAWERRLAIACLLLAVILLFVGAMGEGSFASKIAESRAIAGASAGLSASTCR